MGLNSHCAKQKIVGPDVSTGSNGEIIELNKQFGFAPRSGHPRAPFDHLAGGQAASAGEAMMEIEVVASPACADARLCGHLAGLAAAAL